jgi:hypothetical protein
MTSSEAEKRLLAKNVLFYSPTPRRIVSIAPNTPSQD